MYTRRLTAEDHSFLLFGPRATGKSSWLRATLKDALWYDLLDESVYLRLLLDPNILVREVTAQSKRWIVIDEIQRIPALLNAVHLLLSKFEDKYCFAISGSSARKLKRSEANLLAGRAITKLCFPLIHSEMSATFDIEHVLRFGSLPKISSLLSSAQELLAINTLESYVTTYLEVEIQREAQLRNFDGFVRFLKVAAIMHGQILNISQTASDAGVGRTTAQGYFDILVDTLIGFRLPAWQTRAKVKEVEHPRFYLFDPGIVRALTGRLRDPLDSNEYGRLLEGYILHELRAYIAYKNCGGELSYWRTSDGAEVDLIWRRGDKVIGIEVKSSARWDRKFLRGLTKLQGIVPHLQGYGIFLGGASEQYDQFTVLPLVNFLEALWNSEIIPN
jgi:uncharacterized protein